MRDILIVGALALSLGGCATIINGPSQEVTVNTNPSGADCALDRHGETIARVNPTPASATIDKTKYDITVVCRKAGFQEATYVDKSGIAGAVWGNFGLGGLIGWGVDSATGSDNHYDSPVNITLVPSAAGAAPLEAAPPAPGKPGV
jgi:hypothetical protein